MTKYPIQHITKQVNKGEILSYSWFKSMNTRVDIVLCNKRDQDYLSIVEYIYKELCFLEKTGNYFDPDSELFTLNNSTYNTSIRLSNDLYQMIKRCINYHMMTARYFDISIFSDEHSINTLQQHIYLSEEQSSITFLKRGIRLNLSGFIKGYALEKIRNILSNNNIINALINIGNSSVLALGNHPFGDGWKLRVDLSSVKDYSKEIQLKDNCLTTSGNNTSDRKHIKSPFTGEYINGLSGIAVVTDNAADGEVLSTALFAAQSKKQHEILKYFKAIVYNL